MFKTAFLCLLLCAACEPLYPDTSADAGNDSGPGGTIADAALVPDVPGVADVPVVIDAPSADTAVTLDVPIVDTAVGDSSVADATPTTGFACDAGATGGSYDAGAVTLPCTYATPTTSPGCTSLSDKAFFAALSSSACMSTTFGTFVQNCTFSQGCLAQGAQCADGGRDAKSQCIAGCIAQESGQAVSPNCAWCYGAWAGYCMFEKCLADCAVAPDSPGCNTCMSANCNGQLMACIAGK